MKTNLNLIGKISLCLGLAGALAFATGCATSTPSGNEMKPMKGGEHLLMLNKIETQAQAETIQPDDTFAMICAKCQTVYVTRVRQGAKGAEVMMAKGQPKELIGTHACAGCNSTVTITGHGKGKEMVLKHSCQACGDDSAFCCATHPGDRSTQGMHKKAE